MGVYRQKGRKGPWWLKYRDNDGKVVYESSGTTVYKDACAALKDKQGDAVNGVPVGPTVGKLTWTEAAAMIVTDYEVQEHKSLATLRRRLRLHLTPYFGAYRMADISTDLINKYIVEKRKAGQTKGSVQRQLAVIKRMYTLAIQAKHLKMRPHIPTLESGPKSGNVRRGFFEREEFDALLAHLPAWLIGPSTFTYHTGWRFQSEVLPLEWTHVDRAACVIRLDDSKNGEGRVLPYGQHPEVVAVLEAAYRDHVALAKTGRLCPRVFHQDGTPLTRVDTEGQTVATWPVRKAWETARIAAGMPRKLRHDFRRTAARNMTRRGVPELKAMAIGGWKTRAVFDRYDIIDEAILADAFGRAATPLEKPTTGRRRGTVRPFRARR